MCLVSFGKGLMVVHQVSVRFHRAGKLCFWRAYGKQDQKMHHHSSAVSLASVPSKNLLVILLSSLLSVYVTQYTTRKIISLRKMLNENPLFLLWGILNMVQGKSFLEGQFPNRKPSLSAPTTSRRRAVPNKVQPQKTTFTISPLSLVHSLFKKRTATEEKPIVKEKTSARIEDFIPIDENEIDEDVYYIKLHHQKNMDKVTSATLPIVRIVKIV